MDIEVIGAGRVLIRLSRSELRESGVDFRAMSLSDDPTRTLIGRMLSVIGDMGMRRGGDRVAIDCAPSSDGGAVLLFSIGDGDVRRYRFECADDMIAASLAGALPADIRDIGDDGGGVVISCGEVSDEGLLLEFCEPVYED